LQLGNKSRIKLTWDFFFIRQKGLFTSCSGEILTSAMTLLGAVTGPKYDGKYLHSKVRKLLGETKMHQTLTNVVIPTFDIKLLQPTIFSTLEVIDKINNI